MPIHGYPGGVISATPPTVDNTTASGVWTTEKQLQYQAQGLWPPAVAQPISRSLRFNSADSAYLNRTPGSASNRRTWTWSGWVKRSTLGTGAIFSAGASAPWGQLAFSSDLLIVQFSAGSSGANSVQSVALFRDCSAWYHIVLAIDTTQATDSNRIKMYVNNVAQTFQNISYPAQNFDTQVNDTVVHRIGSYGNTSPGEYFNGYITEINFIDGQQLTPSSFGQTNSNTGVWEPKAFSGTYGTNGFYLNFSDNSGTTSTTLGKDYSGNGNNWTPNNFSVTAGAGNDSLVDTPTSYGTDTGVGGTVRGNYCTFSSIDKATTVTISNGNLDLIGTTAGGRARATMAVSSGKWYFEFLMVDTNNGGSHGFMSTTARSDLTGSGGTTDLGVNADTWGVFANGTVKNNNSNGTSVSAISNGQIGMFALDMDSGKFWYGVNGTWSNSGNPATGANPVYSNLSGYTIAPGIGHGVSTVISYSYNFGQRPFAYTAPSGFKALCTQNLPTPTVAQGDDYFNTITWSGDSVSGRSLTGVGFQPDWVWIKNRNAPAGHNISDAVRGANKRLNSENTGSEATNSGYGYTSAFNSDGFVATAGNVSGYELGDINMSGRTYVAWNWKANGAGSSNTAGTITSTVSANQTAGFSVVTYTGTGANATVGHGLSAAPSMIIIKIRSSSSYGWLVGHVGLTNQTTYYIDLNGTGAESSNSTVWNSTAPTSSVISLGTNVVVNTSSATYVAYCFAAIPGFSAFGRYTGNGTSGDGPFVYLGFRPAWLLIKMTSSSNDWVLYDSKRNTYNTIDDWLYPNLSNAEQTNDAYNNIDFVSNGFKIRGLPGTYTNSNGATYIYAAFAENPFKYALAR